MSNLITNVDGNVQVKDKKENENIFDSLNISESIKELDDMENGRIKYKKYNDVEKMFDDILNEDEI